MRTMKKGGERVGRTSLGWSTPRLSRKRLPYKGRRVVQFLNMELPSSYCIETSTRRKGPARTGADGGRKANPDKGENLLIVTMRIQTQTIAAGNPEREGGEKNYIICPRKQKEIIGGSLAR